MTSIAKGVIIGGCVGIVVMLVILQSGAGPSLLLTVLWPSSAVGIEYRGLGGIDGLVAGAIEVGVQFLIYAVPGGLIGLAVRMVRGER